MVLTPEVSMDIGRPQRIIEIEPVSLPVPGPAEPSFPATPDPFIEPAAPDVRPEPAEPAPSEPTPVEPAAPGG